MYAGAGIAACTFTLTAAMASNVPRRRRGHSLFFTPVSDSGEATETASSASLRAAGNVKKPTRARERESQGQAGSSSGSGSSSFHRSSSSPLIYEPQRPSWSSAREVLALPRSHSNLHFRPQLLPQPLSKSIFADDDEHINDVDNNDDELDPPLLLRRTASQSRAAASSIVPLTGGMARRRVPAELEEDPVRQTAVLGYWLTLPLSLLADTSFAHTDSVEWAEQQ